MFLLKYTKFDFEREMESNTFKTNRLQWKGQKVLVRVTFY